MKKKNIVFILLSILLVFCNIRLGILTSSVNNFETSLSNLDFILWVISALSIGLGALLYSEDEKGYQVFALSNFIGVSLSYYIGYRIGNFNLGTLSLLLSVLLFVYHSQLKNKILLGLLCLAFTSGFSIIVYGVFELVTFIKQAPTGLHRLLFSVITDFSIYIFLLVIALVTIYNLKHSKALHNQGYQTLEQLFGFSRSLKGIGVFLLIPIATCAYYLHTYMYQNSVALLFGLIFLMGPLLIACIKCFTIEKTKQTQLIFLLLQISIISSSCSLLVFRLSA